ncbi:polysaccharide biosynthesis protein [Listeria grandensis FSL F6-0971]|uniref:Polysaccharide biosynthesis protein n=1 Tax=Listeria grandensis FSL F6-0971 TaxID=1265819 RepID=W7BAT2_9LIST|nr:oligosaccharide flippase family protein [Listeria grandensis]EUJ23137.1 polysaccharide biosynthesis protein [Listeria grandensis FSL F6-0971]
MKQNYIYVLLYQFVIVVSPLFTTPYVSRVLGATNIGIDAYVNSIVQIFLVFILLNVGVYGRKQIAETKTRAELKRTFGGIYLMQCLCGVLIGITYLVFMLHVSNFQPVFWIYSLTLIAYSLDISWYFIGREKVKQIMMRNTIVRVLSIACIFLFVRDSGDLLVYVFINAASLLIGQLVTWSAFLIDLGWIHFSVHAMKRHVKPMLLLSVIPCVSLVYTSLNKVILGNVAGETEVGYFNQAFKLYTICMGFVSALSTVIMPRMAVYYKNGEQAKFQKFIAFSFRYVGVTTIPLSFGLIAISASFVPFFLGEAFTPATASLILIAPCLFLAGVADILGLQILLITNQARRYTMSIVISCAVSFATNLWLVTTWKSAGTAFSFLIANVVIVLLQLYLARHHYSFGYFLKIMSKYVSFGVLMLFGVLYAKSLYTGDSNMTSLLIQIGAGIFIYGFSLFLTKDPLLFSLLNRKKGGNYARK